MIKCSTAQSNTTILSLYAPKIASKNIKQILIELHGEINKSMLYSEVIAYSRDSIKKKQRSYASGHYNQLLWTR